MFLTPPPPTPLTMLSCVSLNFPGSLLTGSMSLGQVRRGNGAAPSKYDVSYLVPPPAKKADKAEGNGSSSSSEGGAAEAKTPAQKVRGGSRKAGFGYGYSGLGVPETVMLSCRVYWWGAPTPFSCRSFSAEACLTPGRSCWNVEWNTGTGPCGNW